MDILRSEDQVTLSGLNTQQRLEKENRALSTGLRISSAADDPSGLAIAETQQSRANGLQEGQLDVTSAVNGLTVGEGALHTVASMLQRVRALVVQASSDLNSSADLTMIQTEINQLRSEIDTIGGNTTYNGRPLFDGSLTAQPAKSATVKQVQAQAPNIPGGTGLQSSTCIQADSAGNPGPLAAGATVGNGIPNTFCEISVIGYDPNAVDPVLGPLGGAGDYVRIVAYGDDPSWGPPVDSVTAVPTVGSTSPFLVPPYTNAQITNGNGAFIAISFALAGLTSADVGTSIAFATEHDTAAGTGRPAEVNVGRNEGDLVTAEVPKISSNDLGIANITVLAPGSGTDGNGNVISLPSNDVATRSALIRVDDAIESLGASRAELGAQMVALGHADANAAIDQVNTQASESGIRDANIGASLTASTREQLMTSLQTNVLRSLQVDAKQVASLLSDSITNFGH